MNSQARPDLADGRGLEMAFDQPRPLRVVPGLPDGRARRALLTALRKLGMSAESAEAVGRAVVNPDAARVLLNTPTTYRVPGAELEVIRVDVYTTRIIADATNPRILNEIPFPASGVAPAPNQVTFVPLDPPVSRAHDFSIIATSMEQLIWQLDAAMRATVALNSPRPPIGEQGVMEPPLAVPARIEREDGKPLGGAVLVREGSTRVSHAQRLLNVSAQDALVRFLDDKEQGALIERLNSIAQSPKSTIAPEQAAQIRVATMPLDLVIGVRPDEGSETTLGEAVSAKVAQDHLNHKKQWDDSAKDVHLAESCLIALRDEMLITREDYEWLSGRLPASRHEISGIETHEDDRWTRLVWLFTTRKNPESTVVRRPIATVLERDEGRSRVQFRKDRVPLAVALAMRSRRGAITAAAVERESKFLAAALPSAVWEINWTPTVTPVDDLVEAAAAEAEARETGPASVELAVRAVWYISRHGLIRMPRNDLGPGADRRSPDEVLAGMLASMRGLRQLGRAIVDGREGRPAAYVGDDKGNIVPSGTGDPVILTDDRARNELVPKEGPPVPPPRNPHEEFMDAVAELARKIHAVVAADEALRQLDDGHGSPMCEVEGLAPAQADDLIEKVELVRRHLQEYKTTWLVFERARRQGVS